MTGNGHYLGLNDDWAGNQCRTMLPTQIMSISRNLNSIFFLNGGSQQIPGSLFLGYAFTPFYLIHRCLNKIKKDRAEMIMVALIWQVQPWYPVFMSLECEPPQILPKLNGVLSDPSGCPHPL
jgi:hypothetical protein